MIKIIIIGFFINYLLGYIENEHKRRQESLDKVLEKYSELEKTSQKIFVIISGLLMLLLKYFVLGYPLKVILSLI